MLASRRGRSLLIQPWFTLHSLLCDDNESPNTYR